MPLHITNGDCAVTMLRNGSIRGEFLVWREILHEGPLPEHLDLDALTAVRAQFLGDQGYGPHSKILADLQHRNAQLRRSAVHNETVLWFEHDLYDQLQLLQLLDWFAQHRAPQQVISLVLSDDYLGPMDPQLAADLYARRRPLSEEQFNLAQKAWAAWRAPDPSGLTTLLGADTGALPHLHAALLRWLEEYPAIDTGLSRTERQILSAVFGGERYPQEIFAASQQHETARFMGDTTFWRHLAGLCEQPGALLARSDGKSFLLPASGAMPDAAFFAQSLVLTADGAKVLHGCADALELRRSERWRGGVPLQADTTWCWNAAKRQLIATPGRENAGDLQ